MLLDEGLYALVDRLYDGVTDSDLVHTIMRDFVDLVGARSIYFGIVDTKSTNMSDIMSVGPETSRVDDAMKMHHELVPIDPGLPYVLGNPSGGVFRFSNDNCSLSADPAQWRNFIHHGYGSGGYDSRFSGDIEGISIFHALHTQRDAHEVSLDQQRAHAVFFSHLERAVRLHLRPPDLGVTDKPLLIVDGTASIVAANDRAEALLSKEPVFADWNRTFSIVAPDSNRALHKAIHDVCADNRRGPAKIDVHVEDLENRSRFVVRVGLLPEAGRYSITGRSRCLIEFIDLAGNDLVTPALLIDGFGLTPKEAELACYFAKSHSNLPTIAETMGVRHETARTHLRSVLGKLGVGSQVELARRLAIIANA